MEKSTVDRYNDRVAQREIERVEEPDDASALYRVFYKGQESPAYMEKAGYDILRLEEEFKKKGYDMKLIEEYKDAVQDQTQEDAVW